MDPFKNFGFLLKDVTRLYTLFFEARAREMALTLAQCKVLVRLASNEGVSQARLAELAEVEPMTMVRIIDRMEADGLLERRPDPGDRRARRLYLSPKSKPLLEQIWRLADQTRADAFEGIGKTERDTFMSVLERLHDNIRALTELPSAATVTAWRRPDVKVGTSAKPRRMRSK
jgi:MarR family transcriptional regulator, transcriptional regulator for hemolysin